MDSAYKQDETGTTNNSNPEKNSVPFLLKRLFDDANALASKEVALAKAELRQAANEAKQGLASMAVGGAVAFAALLIFLEAAVFALALFLPLWASALVIGFIVSIVATIMLKSGQKKVKPSSMKPGHTISSFQKDKDTLKGLAS